MVKCVTQSSIHIKLVTISISVLPFSPHTTVLLPVLLFLDPAENVAPRGDMKCYILYDEMECYSREEEECNILKLVVTEHVTKQS